MAIQYYMRGYDAILDTDVDWVVNDTPDTSGAYSGSSNPLTNIRVNRTVQSPVNTIIKSSLPSFVGNQIPAANQYFFYLNGYDWIHPDNPTLPVPVPAPTVGTPYGIAVMRGTTDTANPPTPRDFAAMYWKEGSSPTTSQWNLNYINSAGTPVAYTALAIGTSVPTSGIIRLPNNEFIKSLDLIGGATIPIIGVNTSDRVEIGNSTYGAYTAGPLIADNYVALTNSSSGNLTNVATTGLIRGTNNVTVASCLNNAGNADLAIISSTATDQIVIGESTNNQGVTYRVGNAASSHTFEINASPILSISKDNINGDRINFDVSAYSPVITQDTQSVGNGKSLTIEAQSTSDVAGSGGDVILSSGSGAISSGYVDLRIAGIPKFRVNDTTHISYNGLFQFERNLASVEIEQEVIGNAFGLASNFTISAQDNNGIGGTAGDLILTSGLGAGTNGNLLLQVGGTTYGTIGTNNCDFDFPSTAGIYDFSINTNTRLNIADTATTLDTDSTGAIDVQVGGNSRLNISNALTTFDTDALGLYSFLVNGNSRLSIQDLIVTLDTGTAGTCFFNIDGVTVAKVITDKFETSAGRRRKITDVDDNGGVTPSYTIVDSDDVISVTAITAAFSVDLPASPTTGDTYTIKDSGGNAGTFTITVDAGLNTIDGVATFPLNVNYQSLDVIYNGTEWSII